MIDVSIKPTSPYPKGISVVVCAYNAERRISPTLKALMGQDIQRKAIPWEVILVDNNSSDHTARIAKDFWGDFSVPLIIENVKAQGKTFAYLRGMSTARYEYVIICDDDNHLFPDYLANVFDLFESKLDCAMIGGQGIPLSVIPLPPWFSLHALAFAAAPQKNESGYVEHLHGAGCAIRKSSFDMLVYAGFKHAILGRVGHKLCSGEDYELCLAMRLMGWRLWYDQRLRFHHFFPESRLNWTYMIRMAKANGLSRIFYAQYDQYLPSGEKFRPARLLLVNLGLLVKYYARFRKSTEGDDIQLAYAGWVVKVETLIKYLFCGMYRVDGLKEFIGNARKHVEYRCRE